MHFFVASLCMLIVSPTTQLMTKRVSSEPLHVAMPTPAKKYDASLPENLMSQLKGAETPRGIFKFATDVERQKPFHLVSSTKWATSRQQMVQGKYAEKLSSLIRDVLPHAKVKVSIQAERTVRLQGTVERVDDIHVVVEAARAIFGDVSIINQLAIGGRRLMNLSVVIIRSRPESAPRGFDLVRLCKKYVSADPGILAGDRKNRLGIIGKTDELYANLARLRQSGAIVVETPPKTVVPSGRAAEFIGQPMPFVDQKLSRAGYTRSSDSYRVQVQARHFQSQILLEVQSDLGQHKIESSVILDAGQTFAVGPVEGRQAGQVGVARKETVILVTPSIADQ